MRIRCVANPGCSLGEGPLWDASSQRLYWVDILENRIYRHDPAASTTESWSTPEHVGFVLPTERGLVAGFASGLHHVSLDGDAADAIRIDSVDPRARFNDATLDVEGRIWACTLTKYYCYDRDLRRRTVDTGYGVANGPALSPDRRELYTVETAGRPDRRRGVYASRIRADGGLAHQRLLVDWDATYDSAPDGIVTDADGNLWLGEFGGNVVRRFSPEGDETLAIPLPAWNVTKAALAGDRMFVTSARVEADAETLARYPETGGVLEVVFDS
jgi:D-xylonolactonase